MQLSKYKEYKINKNDLSSSNVLSQSSKFQSFLSLQVWIFPKHFEYIQLDSYRLDEF